MADIWHTIYSAYIYHITWRIYWTIINIWSTYNLRYTGLLALCNKLSWQWLILQLLQQCIGIDEPALCGEWDSWMKVGMEMLGLKMWEQNLGHFSISFPVSVGRGNPIQTEWSSWFCELFSKPQKPSRGRIWALNRHLWTSRLLQWNQNKKKRETDNQFLLILSFSATMLQFCCSKVDWIEDLASHRHF